MIVDNRRPDRRQVLLQRRDREQLYQEALRLSYPTIPLAGNFLPPSLSFTLHIFTVDQQLAFVQVDRAGRHNWINSANHLVNHLTRHDTDIVVAPSAKTLLWRQAPVINQFINNKYRDVA